MYNNGLIRILLLTSVSQFYSSFDVKRVVIDMVVVASQPIMNFFDNFRMQGEGLDRSRDIGMQMVGDMDDD